MARVYIDYTAPESDKISAILRADDTDLRVFAAIALLSEGEEGCELATLADTLDMDMSDISASVKFWRGTGLIAGNKAHKKAEYTNRELADILAWGVRPAFVDEAQRAMGKIFNKNEVCKLIGIVDELGFEEEAVLAILSYCVRLDKKSLSYAEKIAVSFHDSDISTANEVHAQIDFLEKQHSNLEKIRSLYGFGGRALTSTEKKYFTQWTEEYGFDFEVIKKAYEITVDTIHEPVPKYTEKILSRWHASGAHTLDEVEKFIASDRASRPAALTRQALPRTAKGEAGAEVDDWFEQRLKQKYGDKI